jgi:predicted nucleic acid-binding protein
MFGKSGNTRPQVLSAYLRLRFLETVPHKAVIEFIRKHKLENKGVGYVDAHLLAAAEANDTQLWTADPRLLQAAKDLRVAYQPGK